MEQPVARTPRPGMLTADEVAERRKAAPTRSSAR